MPGRSPVNHASSTHKLGAELSPPRTEEPTPEAPNSSDSLSEDPVHLSEDPVHKPSKPELRTKVSDWWQQEKEKLSQGEILMFFQANKEKIEKTLSNIHRNNTVYHITNVFFACVSIVAGWIDRAKDWVLSLLLKLPAPSVIKDFCRSTIEAINFKGFVGFINAKLYSLKKAPHHLPSLQLFDDLLAHAKKDGVELKKYFPDLANKYQQYKHQFLQHSFFTEFAKSGIEKILATPFSFNRSLSPVLPDSRLWHKFFDVLEHRLIKDLILVDESGSRISFKHSPKHLVDSSQVMQRLYQASLFKSVGRRVFIIGHHEGYVGPYCVRSVLRRLGFENLAGNCNTVVGPRMFSNIVLKNGASNVGNLFLTLPSQRTTSVNQKDLAEALLTTAKRTQFLIKMPNSVLDLIEKMTYEEFMSQLVQPEGDQFEAAIQGLENQGFDEEARQAVRDYFEVAHQKNALDELDREDYELFKRVMHEPFLLFPEGSRSYIDQNGDVTMKYINPRYMEAYFRPGDVVLPLNLVGGSDITKGALLSVANMGLSVAEPIIVTEEMISNYQEEGVNVMRIIAALPNIKNVYFDEAIQARTKRIDKAT